MKTRLRWTGFNELLQDLERVEKAGRDVAAVAVEQLAEGTARIARERIKSGHGASAPGSYPHSNSGRLERSISVVMKKARMTTALVGTAMIHGRFLELGTSKMESRPWLLPSLEDARDSELGNLKAEFEGRI